MSQLDRVILFLILWFNLVLTFFKEVVWDSWQSPQCSSVQLSYRENEGRRLQGCSGSLSLATELHLYRVILMA